MLWGLKGQAGKLERTNVTVGLDKEWASHQPFGPDNRRTRFSPDRVAIEDAKGKVLEELAAPRASCAGHALETPWTEPQLAYFAGYAMWTYLNLAGIARAGRTEPGDRGRHGQYRRRREEDRLGRDGVGRPMVHVTGIRLCPRVGGGSGRDRGQAYPRGDVRTGPQEQSGLFPHHQHQGGATSPRAHRSVQSRGRR